MNNTSLFSTIDLLTIANQTPFKAVWAVTDNTNLRHIELDDNDGIKQFAIDQMQIGLDESIAATITQMTINSGQTFNYGRLIYQVPNTTVESNGKLAINIHGKTNFQTPQDPDADSPVFEAITSAVCGVSELILVKTGGILQIGEPGTTTKKGILHVINNSTVHIENSGTLRISDNSELIIYAGSTLILDDWAIIQLEGAGSKIIIHGTLQVNGAITFFGEGCFQFEIGNAITFGLKANGQPNTEFKLVGEQKANRFIRLQAGAELDIPGIGSNLHLQKGTVESEGRIILDFGATGNFIQTELQGGGTTIVEATGAGTINLFQTRVTDCWNCILVDGGTGRVDISGSQFDNYSEDALAVKTKPSLRVQNSLFDAFPDFLPNDAIQADGVASMVLTNVTIRDNRDVFGAWPDGSAGLNLHNVTRCVMNGGLIENCDNGVFNKWANPNLDNTFPSAFFMYNCATIQDCESGIFMWGMKQGVLS